MPGYLGGGSSGGVGGEIRFPSEFIDPVTKLRVSNPENLIDTDFEYGLQPTKWETVELINNTPSFFSKSGDTTIDGILAITTNAGTREITVTTALEHGLSAGIPISVQGTKSLTADGAYIINSIPNETTFTYLCKDVQPTTASIEDLYTAIITGEFFQGAQLRISDEAGIITDGASPISNLTVTTATTHGFGLNTPFYFLNLNSTISQEFPAANTTTKSFDASNSATAQTFDGSNTLSSLNIDFSNAPIVGGAASTISSTNPTDETITVSHTASENFAGLPLGTPLYYDVVAGSGFFAANPRGVVFLKSIDGLGPVVSTFSVSEVPDGPVIDITGSMSGTFRVANQARTFAGNNVNPLTQVDVTIINDAPKEFDAANELGTSGTVIGYSGSNVTVESEEALGWYQGTMLLYQTTGTPATGLTNNTTYFVDFFTAQAGSNFSSFTLKPLPNGTVISGLSGGTGTQTFKQIGLSIDKNIFHVKDNSYEVSDMLRYDFSEGTRFAADEEQLFYFVQIRYDSHNFTLSHTLGTISPLTQSRTGTDAGTAITPTTVTIIGFQEPYSWSVTSGTLPIGLTLNTTTGVISGTPQEVIPAPGREVIITLTDATGAQASQTITFQFNQPPQLYSFVNATFTPGGASGAVGPTLTQARNGLTGSGVDTWKNNTSFFNVSGGIQVWTVPATGTYRMEAYGARGGFGGGLGGGRGARLRGDFALTQGEVVYIVVGQLGVNGSYAGGGGGGTYVWKRSLEAYVDSDAVLIAGGGSGGNSNSAAGIDATTATLGTYGNPSAGASAASTSWTRWGNGQAGLFEQVASNGRNWASGPGAGFMTRPPRHDAAPPVGSYSNSLNLSGSSHGGNSGRPGQRESFSTGSGAGTQRAGSWVGGNRANTTAGDGGFGGGGGAAQSCGGTGAGGGYSGGQSAGCHGVSGGGGSLNRGSNQSNSAGANTGNGFLVITKL